MKWQLLCYTLNDILSNICRVEIFITKTRRAYMLYTVVNIISYKCTMQNKVIGHNLESRIILNR